ncbi:radical SAM protein [Streptomyces sp. SP18BB07]|uniref:radical SAM protein n=1 Tax=Streptomyces sp. SP18BB07 TaxID=3002522 RepID=UPI002E780127|nr:radical SAM protein [Streptomyces sp. SP18BB07]MEE1764396.1 radical SAM protein [Streptomyces sp. SP18BB07]
MTNLGMPGVPAQRRRDLGSGIGFAFNGHHFDTGEDFELDAAVTASTVPLSVILQVTKRCDFDCSFCSETLQLPDPSLDQLDQMRRNLAGVHRVFLSGGEPLMRKDFAEIVDMYHRDHILAVPTNATHGLDHARNIAGKIAFANIGLEGPRATTNRVRGDYDKQMAGVRALMAEGIPLALSAVVYRSTLSVLPFTVQIADVLNAGKVKFILPLRKGNALKLPEHEFISHDEAETEFAQLKRLRSEHMWSPALRLTTWTPENEGHMIVIEPNGIARAWPVYDAKDLWEPLGNVLEEPITEIWKRYRFKKNHLQKYLGLSIHTVPQGVPTAQGA